MIGSSSVSTLCRKEETILSSNFVHWIFNEGDGNTVHNQVLPKPPLLYKNDRGLRPQWRKGRASAALWLDGYSSYLESEYKLDQIDAFTIEVWIAPRNFSGYSQAPSAIINQHSRRDQTGFLLGLDGDGCAVFQAGSGAEWIELSADKPLERGSWSQLIAAVSNSSISLYVNGEKAADRKVHNFACKPSDAPLMIGKHNEEERIAGVFIPNMFSGLMDEVKFVGEAVAQEGASALFHSPPPVTEDQIGLNRNEWKQDRHRPQFHASPPGHWMNEPHAPFFYKGKYHLFYQHNPQGPFWGNIHWGHWISEDLIHWKDLPVALAPGKFEVDPIGTWSGSASFDEEGNPVLFFTAGNSSFTPNQMTGLAYSTVKETGDLELKEWKKHPLPVVTQPEGMNLHHDGFRDPFVWKEDGRWFQLVASGFEGKGGTIPVFVSDNLTKWDFKGFLMDFPHEKYPHLGEIWELPVLLPISPEKHILLISPVGKGAHVEVYYWIGEWKAEEAAFLPDFEEPKLIDLGLFHFTGPSGMIDPHTGKILLFTIAQGERTVEKEYESGWAHTAGMPVQLSLDAEGGLLVEPADAAESLREEALLALSEVTAKEAQPYLKEVKGDMLDILLEVEAERSFALRVRMTPDQEEETVFLYDAAENRFSADRTRSTRDPAEKTGGIQGGKLEKRLPVLKVRLLLDKSLIEVYLNNSQTLTTRTYPDSLDALGIRLDGPDDLKINALNIWRMKSIYY